MRFSRQAHLVIALLAASLLLPACGGDSAELEVVQTEEFELNGVDMTSRIVEVQTQPSDGGEPYPLRWHYVVAGKGDPVIFLHGLPESWYSWHYQMEALSDEYRVIGIDLKGYGQSDKSDGDYSTANVAAELLALFDALELDKVTIVSHDWGTMVADELAGNHPDRIERYVRMQVPVHKADPKNHFQLEMFRDQALAERLFSAASRFIRTVYEQRTVQSVPESDLARVVEEFSRPGVAQAVPRYFRDLNADSLLTAKQALFANMDFPVLLLQADADPAQPQWYFDGATGQFPNAELRWVTDSGHFSELEQPQQVVDAIRAFLRR